MTPEERQYKAGTWILGLTFSVIVWAIVIESCRRLLPWAMSLSRVRDGIGLLSYP